MPRKKRPRIARLDHVRISRSGDEAIVEFLDPAVAATRLRVGPQVQDMTDEEVLLLYNFNDKKVANLLREHQGEVVQERFLDMESWYVLRSLKPGVLVRDLCKQYQIETLREYRHRSRTQIHDARKQSKKI